MNDRQQDTELRAHFDAQRHTERIETPPFATMYARARAEAANVSAVEPRGLNIRRLMYVGGLAAAAAIGGLLMVPRSPSSEDAFEQTVREFQKNPALGAWRSPTDGLLNIPGSQLITTVPGVGTL